MSATARFGVAALAVPIAVGVVLVVLFGPAGHILGLQDSYFETLTRLTPGRPSWAVFAESGLAALAAALLAALLILRGRLSVLANAALSLLCVLVAALVAFAFNLHRIDPTAPGLLLAPALFIGAFGGIAIKTLNSERTTKKSALRVVGKRVRGAERREVSVLVCKIRELDAVTETFRQQPQALAQVVSKLMTNAKTIAGAYGGTIESISASRTVALFNAPHTDSRHAEHATEAALSMLGRLEPLNQEFEKLFKPGTFSAFNFSIGIETGDALVGELGFKRKGELSALGPAVDMAGLLADRARTYGPAILVGAQAEARINRGFALLQLDLIETGGGVRAPFYALMGNPLLRASPRFKGLQTGFNAFHKAYRRGNWDQASAILRQCAKLSGANPRLVLLFERRLDFLKERPPDAGWNGILRAPVE